LTLGKAAPIACGGGVTREAVGAAAPLERPVEVVLPAPSTNGTSPLERALSRPEERLVRRYPK
jgi:hypothetical protein